MGNSHSTVPKAAQGHPEEFYRGVKAAKEGRFTVSELYFVQALQGHPGHGFWDTFTKAVLQKDRKAEVDADKPAEKDEEEEHADATAGTESDAGGPLNSEDKATARKSVFTSNGEGGETADTISGRKSPEDEDEEEEDDRDAKATDADAKTNGTHSVFSTKVTEVQLPLSGQITPILDYFRLMADVQLTYLELVLNSPYKQKVSGLAARYCLFTINHTQMLLHCLTLWKEDKFSGEGGFIDYEKKRNLKFGTDVSEDQYAELDTETQSSSSSKQKWRTMDRTASLLFTLALLEANCRYYFLSSVTNYCGLLIETYPTVKEGRKQNRVYSNVMEHLEVVFATIWDVAKEYPNEYLSKLIMTNIPRSSSGDRDFHSSVGASSHASNQMSMSLGNDQHRHLYASGSPWAPTQSALMPLIIARNVRLSVQESVSRRAQAQLRSPAERMSYHYIMWRSPVVLLAVPGCSVPLLQKSLPDFVPGKGTLLHRRVTFIRRPTNNDSQLGLQYPTGNDENAAVHVSPEEDMMLDLHPELDHRGSAAEARKREENMRKCKEAIVKTAGKVNTDLNLSDERTCVMLCLNEVSNISVVALLWAAQLRYLAELPDAAAPYATGMVEMTSGIYGPESPELFMVRGRLESIARASQVREV
ncbi:sodium stibogluconate resistance protein [Novymonas esmeraldas]|uniref:Sodium stibogluconate resistance protein n=1 Tax=Novymonas esmeraldas TaxID=1808958 RepID=A0AAW0F8G3_9TRYP